MPLRVLLVAFLVAISVGYTAGLYFVWHTTNMSVDGTTEQFLGNEDASLEEITEIKYRKDTLEMMNIIHTHVTSFALIYLAVGAIFLFGSAGPRTKVILATEPFAATLVLFGGMWGLRYVGGTYAPLFAIVIMIAGLLTAVCFYTMVTRSLVDLMRKVS